uniref:carbonic anhydrase n=1 Tax=viral metagenome TaxID=1070528 RepID=A0A6C0IIG0_9ZZZZ
MTCPNATAPVNIVNNPDLICDLKCDYRFKYPNSSLNVANRGDYLSLKTDVSNTPPVTYNSNKYEVSEMRLYQPSLHDYSGKKADAELIIIHNNVSSQGNLLVCVPVVNGSSNPESLSIFDTLISEVSKTANSPGSKTTVNIPTFSIDKFIPRKPYYSYTGTLPYSPCNGEYDYVVFSKDNDAVISLSNSAYLALKKIITANVYESKKNNKGVYFNENGPSTLTGSGKGDIYMECLPTGNEGESLVPLAKSSEQMFSMGTVKNMFKNNLFLQVLIGILLILGLTKLGTWLLAQLTSDNGQNGGVKIKSGGMRSGGMKIRGGLNKSVKNLFTRRGV